MTQTENSAKKWIVRAGIAIGVVGIAGWLYSRYRRSGSSPDKQLEVSFTSATAPTESDTTPLSRDKVIEIFKAQKRRCFKNVMQLSRYA